MLETFTKLVVRTSDLRQLFFPETSGLFLTQDEKEVLQNVRLIRNVFREFVDKRRAEMKMADYQEKGDLLSTLVQDELFDNDTEVIIDQCMTFFFAGSQTLFFSTSNLIMYLMQNRSWMEKVRQEY